MVNPPTIKSKTHNPINQIIIHRHKIKLNQKKIIMILQILKILQFSMINKQIH
jgi:hypothetical protein